MGGKWKKHKAAQAAAQQAADAGQPAANGQAVEETAKGFEPEPMQTESPEPAAAPTHHVEPSPQPQQPVHVKQAAVVKPHKPAAKAAKAQTQAQAEPNPSRATLSIAVAGSVLESAPSAEVAAAIAAQIARAAAIFSVDEVVVYDDQPGPSTNGTASSTVSLAAATLARLLLYIETPGHLRAALFPGSVAYPELRAGEAVCPNLQAPHHQRGTEWQVYREGVVMRSEPGMGSFVDIGYDRNAHVEADLPMGRRVTVNCGPAPRVEFVPAFSETMLKAEVVSPREPCLRTGKYWGYSVRIAPSLSRALKDTQYKGGYDVIIGTSDQGVEREVAELVLPKYKHALVLFGGAKDLEEICEDDEALAQSGKTPSDLCSMYLNCCPGQGVTELRTEDAVTVCLAYLHASLMKYGGR